MLSRERERQREREGVSKGTYTCVEHTVYKVTSHTHEKTSSPSSLPLSYSPFLSQLPTFYKCLVSGPGASSATVNHPTHILVQLRDSSDRPCSLPLNVTVQLKLVLTDATPSRTRWPRSKKRLENSVSVAMVSPSQYKVTYIPVSRGQHKLYIRVRDRDISPFTVTVYPDPRQLGHPVRTVTGLFGPRGIAFNSHHEMIVSEYGAHRLSIYDIRGQKIQTFGSHGDSRDKMEYPAGIATDDADCIYVSSKHKLQKFTSHGKVIKFVGKRGRREGEFDDPRGVTLYGNQVYVCDCDNHRIQVFDLDLSFVRSIGSQGEGNLEFKSPFDVKFDTAGNMYVAELGNGRVQVLDSSGKFIRVFGQEENEGKALSRPSGLHIADKYVYVSDYVSDCIAVYETSGQFVTSFGKHGQNEGEFHGPCCITSCPGSFVCISDFLNNRVQLF